MKKVLFYVIYLDKIFQIFKKVSLNYIEVIYKDEIIGKKNWYFIYVYKIIGG